MTNVQAVATETAILAVLVGLILRSRGYWFFVGRVIVVIVFWTAAWRLRPPQMVEGMRMIARGRSLKAATIERFVEPAIQPLAMAILVCGVVLLLIFLYHRWFLPRFDEWRRRFLVRPGKMPGDCSIPSRMVRADKLLNGYGGNAPGYFVGFDGKKKPVLIESFRDLTMHVQVVGPSGQGKTVSVIAPLAVQGLMKGQSCVLVDGKGDMNLAALLMSLAADRAPTAPVRLFAPLRQDLSLRYNPLLSTRDANELVDMLVTGLALEVPGAGRVYGDTQKAFLLRLFNLFLSTGKRFHFEDVLLFMNDEDVRQHVYGMGDQWDCIGMKTFMNRLKPNGSELLGLSTLIDKLFVSDKTVAGLLNTYRSDIDMKEALSDGGLTLFSFSAGKKAETNQALAKMVLADIANAVGDRYAAAQDERRPAMLVLDEFGQFAPPSFDKFISSAREAQVACVLSHQSNAQLHDANGVDRLAQIVRENTATKFVFRQTEEADFWARCFGTVTSVKRTEQVEPGRFYTERLSSVGSLREVEEFRVHPNVLRGLPVGQAVFRSKNGTACVANLGMLEGRPIELRRSPPAKQDEEDGLNLRAVLRQAVEKRAQPGRRVI